MSKVLIFFALFIAAVSAQMNSTTTPAGITTASPQKIDEAASRTYAMIKGFKGSKDDLFKKLDDAYMAELKTMTKASFNEDYLKRVAESVAKKIAKDDVITSEEFQRFAALEIQKLKLEAAKKS
ncbi:hypothetical protein PVAND_015075 [Polypedilum vanderplanki]|uniref:Uncharacterized protein n=1 Tax=Polypedilum vanderplanki TaxID=319348 RepID=A0A9J6BB66_POLVA|nr:hypothetical protein PVAND_015075 [Polypedilum vanderplanki]